jgi:hypothetical protein
MIGFPYHASIEQLGRLVIDPPSIVDDKTKWMERPILKSTLDTIAPQDGAGSSSANKRSLEHRQ